MTILLVAAFCSLFFVGQRLVGVGLHIKFAAHGPSSGKLMQNQNLTLNARQIAENVMMTRKSKEQFANNCTDEFRRKHFLASIFCDRTGNRFFQLAALLATAQRVCYTPVLHRKDLEHLQNIFDIKNTKLVTFSVSLFRNIREPAAGMYDVNLTSRINPNYNWTLLGYRQSFKYFEGYATLVRSSLRIKDGIKRNVLQYLSSFSMNLQKVGLHVRRGDFLNRQREGFTVSALDYINRAIAIMNNRLGKERKIIFVASDDIKWCKENIKGADIRYPSFNDVGKDLYLLTQCDHHIITSGTFGWTGAWLNETGIVVYDKSYPKPNTTVGRMFKLDDYYPSRWIGL